MCFRPAEAGGNGPVQCPNCGKRINRVNGELPSKCPFCKVATDDFIEMEFPKSNAPSIPAPPAATAPRFVAAPPVAPSPRFVAAPPVAPSGQRPPSA